jgi:hypothetical protein
VSRRDACATVRNPDFRAVTLAQAGPSFGQQALQGNICQGIHLQVCLIQGQMPCHGVGDNHAVQACSFGCQDAVGRILQGDGLVWGNAHLAESSEVQLGLSPLCQRPREDVPNEPESYPLDLAIRRERCFGKDAPFGSGELVIGSELVAGRTTGNQWRRITHIFAGGEWQRTTKDHDSSTIVLSPTRRTSTDVS